MNQPIQLRVSVDRERCQGHNRCYALAPELFEIDDLGTSREVADGLVPAELEGKARLAVANCPEEAVSISPA
jgi:ferredoxin